MPDFLPLNIFPVGALASSVITTVWVGVFVVAFFNLRLGWVLSGLVVPGYLVPLLLLKPSAAFVVVAEGIVTYFIVWLYSEWLSARFGWSNFFGRDRFFALVLTSVIVRIVCDGWMLPLIGEYLVNTWQLQFDYRNNLHSFGLIIVSLIANNFWKTGFYRGVFPLFVTIAVTYLLVRFGLMELTNFSVSNIGYLYEDMASSILASPKAYIILLTTAFVASRMNLFYGWDFSGILVPSLLALQWYQPEKIAMSLVEALVILALAILALRTPFMKGLSIEGARKILLFFNISFAYKLVLAYVLLWLWPNLKVSDYYGFGYLLPTLLAIKMHDKEIVARMTRATLQTSIVAAFVATIIGFCLSLMPDSFRWFIQGTDTLLAMKPVAVTGSFIDHLRADKIQLYRTRVQGGFETPSLQEEEAFVAALRLLAQQSGVASEEALGPISTLLDIANYKLELQEDRYYVLREKEPRKYWGTYIINPGANNDLIVEIPAPIDEHRSLEAGAWLFRYLDARMLAVAGSARRANKDGSSDVLANPNTPFHFFHRTFARQNILQVRTYTAESSRLLSGERREKDALSITEPDSTLRVKGNLPTAFSLRRFKDLVDDFDIAWEPIPLMNLQRESVSEGFVEITFNRDDVRKVLARSLAAEQSVRLEILDHSIEGYLQDWLLADRERIAAAGSNQYRVPHTEDLLYIDDEIVTPLLRAARRQYGAAGWSSEGLEELKLINIAASLIGYELVRYHHKASGSDYVILAEPGLATPRRYWGTYVFRLGAAGPFLLEVPRPIFEINSFEFSVSMFERLKASALLIGGAHPDTNQDHRADITKLVNKINVFSLVSQSIVREDGDKPLLILQGRALSVRPQFMLPPSDILLSFAHGLTDPSRGSAMDLQLLETLRKSGHSVEFSGGSIETAGYEASSIPQGLYTSASKNKEFAVAWVSPLARNEYRQQTEPTPQAIQFAALHIPSKDVDLAHILTTIPPTGGLPAKIKASIDAYIRNQDIVLLQDTLENFPNYRFERLVDLNSRRGYLIILDNSKHWCAVANLSSRPSAPSYVINPERSLAEDVGNFLEGNASWLLAEVAPP